MSRSLCIIDEALCPSGVPFLSFLQSPTLASSDPPAWDSEVGAGEAERAIQPCSAADTMGRGRQSPAGGGCGELSRQSGCLNPGCRSAPHCGAGAAVYALRPGSVRSVGAVGRASTPGHKGLGLHLQGSLGSRDRMLKYPTRPAVGASAATLFSLECTQVSWKTRTSKG
jgi:hypothetical protein